MQTEIEIHTATQDGNAVVVVRLGEQITVLPKQDAIDIAAALMTAAHSFDQSTQEVVA